MRCHHTKSWSISEYVEPEIKLAPIALLSPTSSPHIKLYISHRLKNLQVPIPKLKFKSLSVSEYDENRCHRKKVSFYSTSFPYFLPHYHWEKNFAPTSFTVATGKKVYLPWLLVGSPVTWPLPPEKKFVCHRVERNYKSPFQKCCHREKSVRLRVEKKLQVPKSKLLPPKKNLAVL